MQFGQSAFDRNRDLLRGPSGVRQPVGPFLSFLQFRNRCVRSSEKQYRLGLPDPKVRDGQ